MLKPFLISSSLVFTVGLVACHGQEKQATSGQDVTEKLESPTDHDPYFIETQTITSTNGPGSITRNMIQDRNGYIWLATWEGIMGYDTASCIFTNFTNKAGLRRYHAFAVMEDRNGILWFGTIGAGVYRYDGKSFTNYTTQDGLASDRIGCFLEDQAGNIWIGTDGGVSCFDGKSFRNFTKREGLTDNDINSIIEDKSGKLWFGARGEACYYDGTKFTRVTNAEGMPFTNVRCIIEDQSGNIWLAGQNGLWRYDGESYTNYTTGFVGYVYEDKEGNIWTSADHKDSYNWVLSRYDVTSLSDVSADATQIRQNEQMLFGILKDANGNIWFGSGYGACRYDGKTFDCFGSRQ